MNKSLGFPFVCLQAKLMIHVFFYLVYKEHVHVHIMWIIIWKPAGKFHNSARTSKVSPVDNGEILNALSKTASRDVHA